MPQVNLTQNALAMSDLAEIVALADHLVVIAPTAENINTGERCNVDTYNAQGRLDEHECHSHKGPWIIDGVCFFAHLQVLPSPDSQESSVPICMCLQSG